MNPDNQNQDSVVEATAPPTEKTKKARSSPYPSYTIDHCIEVIKRIRKVFPQRGAILKRADLVSILKSGYMNMEIGSCVQYGLLDRSKTENEVYIMNAQSEKVAMPLGNELSEVKWDAFKNPKLYKELFSRYDGHFLSEEDLPYILQRFHGITDKAVVKAISIFIENAKSVGALDEHNILRASTLPHTKQADIKIEKMNEGEGEIKDGEIIYPDEQIVPPAVNGIEKKNQDGVVHKPLELSEINNAEKEKLRLPDNRFMYLEFPNDFAKRDIEVLRKWCDMNELTRK